MKDSVTTIAVFLDSFHAHAIYRHHSFEHALIRSFIQVTNSQNEMANR